MGNIPSIAGTGLLAYVLMALGIYMLNLLIKWLVLSSAINKGIQDATEAILEKYEFVNNYEIIKETKPEEK